MIEQEGCLEHYDFYFSLDRDRQMWYCYLSRCVLSETVPSMF